MVLALFASYTFVTIKFGEQSNSKASSVQFLVVSSYGGSKL